MSLHINRFIDSVKAHESRNARDFTMSMRDAKDLHGDITKLLLAMQAQAQQPRNDTVVTVEVDGGKF